MTRDRVADRERRASARATRSRHHEGAALLADLLRAASADGRADTAALVAAILVGAADALAANLALFPIRRTPRPPPTPGMMGSRVMRVTAPRVTAPRVTAAGMTAAGMTAAGMTATTVTARVTATRVTATTVTATTVTATTVTATVVAPARVASTSAARPRVSCNELISLKTIGVAPGVAVVAELRIGERVDAALVLFFGA
jgi:hypothetical protein